MLKTFAVYLVFKKSLTQIYFNYKSKLLCIIYDIEYFLLFSLISNNLTNYERRHFKLLTNSHVPWDTL